jgi:hypothetical protein
MRAPGALVLAATMVAGCGGSSSSSPPPVDPPMIASMAELGQLMKNDINPVFSKLTFLMFHGDEVETDADALTVELGRNAALLRQALDRLRALERVPTRTAEGREVFFTYAESVTRSTDQLLDAIEVGERLRAAAQLEQIAETCNSCHHFFRLRIEDAVVPRRD